MSFTDRLVLALHIAFVIFTIGPVTAAIMASSRAIRTRNIAVLRYLLLTTRIFGAASLGILVFGIILGQSLKDLGKAWLVVSMTLFVVALVLLLLIMRDQRRAIAALKAASQETPAHPPAPAADEPGPAEEAGQDAAASPHPPAVTAAGTAPVATVERGRILSLGGIVGLIWLAILVLMVWQP
ncbi:MAG TPA: hypothetical protein VIX86_00145 [Streptosporangiaceae bacterium]